MWRFRRVIRIEIHPPRATSALKVGIMAVSLLVSVLADITAITAELVPAKPLTFPDGRLIMEVLGVVEVVLRLLPSYSSVQAPIMQLLWRKDTAIGLPLLVNYPLDGTPLSHSIHAAVFARWK